MALTPEQIDAIDTGDNRRALTPDEIDSLPAQPIQPIQAPRMPGTGTETTTGGNRVALAPAGDTFNEMASTVEEGPGSFQQNLGRSLGYTGRLLKAGGYEAYRAGRSLGATGELPPNAENLEAAITMPPGEALPIEQKEKLPLPVRVTGGLLHAAPRFAALALAPEALLAQSVAAGGLFGIDDEGKFHVKDAIVGAALPGVGKVGRYAVGAAMGKVAAGGGVLADAVANMPEAGRKIIETIGEQASLDAFQTAMNSPELYATFQKDPEEFRSQLAEIIGSNLGFALLGAGKFSKKVPSETRKWVMNNADTLAAKRVIQSIPPENLRDIYNRVNASDPSATQEEKDLVSMINGQLGKPAEAIKRGAEIVEEGWPERLAKVLGLNGEANRRFVRVAGEDGVTQPVGEPKQLTAGEIDSIPVEKGTDAVNPVSETVGVSEQPQGVDALQKANEGPGVSNRVPGAAGKPAKGPLTAEQIDQIPQAVEPTVPEKPETISAQLQMLQDGKRNAVMITKGEALPKTPKGFAVVNRGDNGTFIFNPAKVTLTQIDSAIANNTIGTLLGYGIPAKPAAGTEVGAVVVRSPEGVEKHGALTDAQNLPAVVSAAQQAASPGDTIALEPEQQVINQRLDLKPDMATARRVAAMTPAEFQQAFPKGFNSINLPLGQSVSKADVTELVKLRDGLRNAELTAKAKAEQGNLIADVQDYVTRSAMTQFFNEAIVEANKKPSVERQASDVAEISDDEIERLMDQAEGVTKAPTSATKPSVAATKQPKPATSGRSLQKKQSASTPLMEQYLRIKRGLPEGTLLAMRMGDFYEFYFKDADLASAILNIPFTKRNNTPMAGIPYHAAQASFEKLISAGLKVAVVDQSEGSPTTGRAQGERSAADIAKEAAKAGVKGIDESLKGLHDLFGGSGLSAGAPIFNEETYAKAKPHFQSAYEQFVKAGKSMAEFLQFIFKQFSAGVRPYITRFIKELRAAQSGETVTTGANQPTESTGSDLGLRGGQPAIAGGTGAERPTPAGGPATGPELQPGIREENAGATAGGGTGGSGIANAPAVGSPAEQQAGAGQRPGSGVNQPGAGAIPGQPEPPKEQPGAPSELNPAPTPEIGPGKPAPKNIRLTENPAPTGPVARVDANIKALALVKKLEEANSLPTDEERKTLAAWSGWGSFKELFNEGKADRRDYDQGWMKRYGKAYDRLRTLMTDDEFNAAAESSVNAHYTSLDAIRSMWDLARRLGFKGGKALEPSAGSGLFVGGSPEDMPIRWTGVELDPITGKIFGYLYPEADTRIEGFEVAKLARGFYDIAISNVPFHEVGPGKHYPIDLNLHNYFLARMIDMVKPGGIVLAITTHNTMDARAEQRRFIAEKAQLVGAIRLPNDAFKESAATEVVTDILVLRKPDGTPFDGQAWLGTQEVEIGDSKSPINEYFATHPEMVLGRHALTGTMYRKDSYTVESTPGKLVDKLAEAIARLPENITQRSATIETVQTRLDENTLVVEGGHVMEARNFQLYPVQWTGKDLVRRAKDYIGLRDILKAHYALERDASSVEAEVEASRSLLKATYEKWLKTHGNLNLNDRKLAHLRNDPDYYTVMGLEIVRDIQDSKDPTQITQVVEPATVLTERVIPIEAPPAKVENAMEAMAVSMAYKGSLDLEYVQQLTGMGEEQIIADLVQQGLAFKNPETGKTMAAAEYLTGEVREKLSRAIFAAKEDPSFQVNVDALKAVIPPTEPFDKIKVTIASTWVPPTVLNKFATSVMGINGDPVTFIPRVNEFNVKKIRERDLSQLAVTQWGTKDLSPIEVLQYALSVKRARIMRLAEKDKYVEDVSASALANQLIVKAGAEFEKYIRTTSDKVKAKWFDVEIGNYVEGEIPVWDAMEREYNRSKNSFVVPEYDGKFLKFPGLSSAVRRTPHLLNGVMRAIQAGSVVFAHGVGSGKTFLFIVSSREMKRIGLVKKPVLVVKKSTVDQFRKSIERAYPGSKVLIPDRKDFESANRRKLIARMASTNWDFIVLTHEQFKSVPTSEDSVRGFFNEQIDMLKQVLREMGQSGAEDAKSTRGMDSTTRNVVRKIKTLRKRMTKHVDAMKEHQDVGMSWENIGIDGIWLDEAHNFKKMPIATQLEVKGVPSDFSQRAVDLLIKMRDVQRRTNNRNVFFGTGTPISNTLAELWVMLYATNPKILDDYGVGTFDSFASTYADVVTNFEFGWDGRFKDITRMARFKNPASLTTMTRLGLDVRIGNKELGLDVPEIEGGKPEIVGVETTPSFEKWIEFLEEVVGVWNTLDPKGRFENSWVPIATMRAGVAAALDPRLIFPGIADHPGSKVNTAVKDIFAEWERGKEKRTTMMVFADLYKVMDTSKLRAFVGGRFDIAETAGESETTEGAETPEAEEEIGGPGQEFLYSDVRRKLVKMGVPEHEIGVITEHDTDAKREKLFNGVRQGIVRILIGSTEKIGEGVDVPQRMSAQFHLDPPGAMTPAKQEQRVGRIIRQGNLHSPLNWNLPVRLKLYAMKRSMDATIYPMLARKAIGVIQALQGKYLGDSFDDPAGETIISMSEAAAIASGNPLVLEMAVLQKAVRELSLEYGAYLQRNSELSRSVENAEREASREGQLAASMDAVGGSVSKAIENAEAVILTHPKSKKVLVGWKAVDEFLEKLHVEVEAAVKEKGAQVQSAFILGNDVRVLFQLKNDYVWGNQRSLVIYIGKTWEPKWDDARYDTTVNSIESIPAVLKGLPDVAVRRAAKARATQAEQSNLASLFSKQFAENKFEKADELKAKRDRLNEVENQIRLNQSQRDAAKTAATADLTPKLSQRLSDELDQLMQAVQQLHDAATRHHERAKILAPSPDEAAGELAQAQDIEMKIAPIEDQIATLSRQFALVSKDELERSKTDISYPTAPVGPGGVLQTFFQVTPDDLPMTSGEEQAARGIQSIMTLLNDPRSGLTDEARRVALEMLNEPALRDLDWSRLTLQIQNSRFTGMASPAKWLVMLSRNANAATFPHELFHLLYEMLPTEDRLHVDQLRRSAITEELASFGGFIPPEVGQLLSQLAGAGMSSQDFVAMLERAKGTSSYDWLRSIYPLINPSEFLASAAGESYAREASARHESWFAGLIERIRAWVRNMIDSIKRAFGVRPDLDQIIREILAGKRLRPENGAMAEEQWHGSIDRADELKSRAAKAREDAIELGVKEKWIPTQVFGQKDFVRGREEMTPLSRAASASHTKSILDQSGISYVREAGGLFRFVPSGESMEVQGQRLLDILRKEIQTKGDDPKTGDLLGNLLNTVVYNYHVDGMEDFSSALREALYDVAQSDRSQRGIALAALAGYSRDISFVAKNVNVVLHRIYADAYGGEAISSVMDRLMTAFREYFTDDEIRAALKDKPELTAMIEKLVALNRRDEGGRVYRKAQVLLKPKAVKKLALLESDARINEAVDQIIENLRAVGVEPKPSPNRPLGPLERLLVMVAPENADKIDKAIALAIEQAERNAGIKATLKTAKNEVELADMQDEFANGGMPSEEMIEEGLSTPEFEHWRVLRDNLLDYDPTTLKLVQDLLRSDFRGTRFGQPMARPAETRLNLEALARQPDDEVTRVLNGYVQNLNANMNLSNATDTAKARVDAMVMDNLVEQLELARKRVRDVMFKEKVPGVTPPTADEQITKLVNAGLFRDQRLDLRDMAERAASKSRVQRLMPRVPELVKQIFETPFYRRDEVGQRFAELLTSRLGIAPEQAARAREVFEAAFKQAMDKALVNALKIAEKGITPQKKKVFGRKRAVWQRIERAVNAGIFDSGSILRGIADAHGWKPPTDEQVAKMKALAEKEQQMRELTPQERRDAGDEADQAKAQREKEAATLEARVIIKKQLETMWAKMTRPISFLHFVEHRRNFAAAVNEYTSANMLLKVGFAPRQLIGIITQGAVHTPTRALAAAIERWQNDRSADRDSNLWLDVGQAFKDAYKQRFSALRSALYATRAALVGRGEARNVDRLMSAIAAIERISLAADEKEVKGQKVQAVLLRAFTLIKFGYRVAQALDNLHGLPAEYQEMRQQVVTALRENGKSRAEAEISADWVMGDMNTQWLLAIDRARSWMDAAGLQPTEREVRESGWQIVKRWQYDRMAELQLPADDFEEANRLLRNTVGWNERETTGIGGVVAKSMAGLTQVAQGVGVPLPVARFGNAIGIGINRSLMFTPFYKLAEVGGTNTSAWFASAQDRRQRQIEAALGSLIGIPLLLLAALGLIHVRNKWPKDKEERELWQRIGRRPGTAEFPLPDGSFLPVSMTVGPLQYVAPYLAAGGALRDLLDEKAKAQAKLNKDAADRGLNPGKVAPLGLADGLGVAATAAESSIFGGRTASGLAASISDYGIPNASRAVASQVSALVPGLPGAQELARMGGAQLDSKVASFWDFMLPMPTSGAQGVNLLGDPVGNPDALKRITQILSGGSGLPINEPLAKAEAGYSSLFVSGYRPPSIDPGKGYAIGNDYRPMNANELERYTALRGQYLKQELAGADPADPKSLKEAYQSANQRALEEVGVDTSVQKLPTERATAPTASRGGGQPVPPPFAPPSVSGRHGARTPYSPVRGAGTPSFRFGSSLPSRGVSRPRRVGRPTISKRGPSLRPRGSSLGRRRR